MRFIKYIFIFHFLINNLIQIALAKDGKWVIAQSQAVAIDISPKEAEQQALQAARLEALRIGIGIEIIMEQIDFTSAGQEKIIADIFSSFTKSKTRGKIIEEQILDWKTEFINLNEKQYPQYSVKIKAKVIELIKNENLFFDLKINKTIFENLDEVIITCEGNFDCYVTIFNLLADNTISILFPNQYLEDNFVKANEPLQIPNEEFRNLGLKFRQKLPENSRQTTEGYLAVATRTKTPFKSSQEKRVNGIWVIPGYKNGLCELNKWLVTLGNEWAEATRTYIIIDK